MDIVYDGIPFSAEVFKVASPFVDAFRWIGYGLLQCLGMVLDTFYNAINGMLLINITDIPAVKEFTDTISPVAWSVLTVAIIFACIMLMIFPTKKEMFRGVCIAVLLMVSVPMMFTTLDTLKSGAVADISGQITDAGQLGKTVLSGNTIDVVASTATATPAITYITTSGSEYGGTINPYQMDINARIEKGTVKNPATGYEFEYNKKVDYTVDGDGGTVAYGSDLADGFFGWGEERLYAYQFDFVGMFVMMLIMLVALFFTGFKVGKTIFELITHQAIAPIVFASDIQGAGRTKKFLQSLISNYIVLIMILLLLKLYMELMTWICASDYDIWIKIFVIAGASWGVIDGPDVILKILGVDAGVKSATGMLMGAMAAGNIVGGAGKAVGGVAHAAAQMPQVASRAAGGVAGAVSGARNMAGNAQMGHTVATNPAARLDAGASNLSELRQGLDRGADQAGAAPAGYSNTPPASPGYFSRLGQNFTGTRDRVATAIDQTAATAGYAVGQAQNRMQQPRNAGSSVGASTPTGSGSANIPPQYPAPPSGQEAPASGAAAPQYPIPPFAPSGDNDDTV